MPENKIIIACDSFKGCMTSSEVNATVAEAVRQWHPSDALTTDATTGTTASPEVITLEMSDGGEGMLSAFANALGADMVNMTAHDALMRPIRCSYAMTADTAIIEVAQTVGLQLIEPEQRNPMRTTSWGVGEQVLHAYRHGARRFIIGLGGSATSDSGTGMLRALDNKWRDIAAHCQFTLASDVTNPLCGPNGAAHVFAPQKGATPAMVQQLDDRARRFAEASNRALHRDCSDAPGAGAAGGLGYAFMQYLGATVQSGADLLLTLTRFDDLLPDTLLIITGEGHSDRQTLMGKLPSRILAHALPHNIPVWLLSGAITDAPSLLAAGFSRLLPITPSSMPLEEALKKETARSNIIRLLQATKLS